MVRASGDGSGIAVAADATATTRVNTDIGTTNAGATSESEQSERSTSSILAGGDAVVGPPLADSGDGPFAATEWATEQIEAFADAKDLVENYRLCESGSCITTLHASVRAHPPHAHFIQRCQRLGQSADHSLFEPRPKRPSRLPFLLLLQWSGRDKVRVL
jgi:hypothetical protein